MRRTESLTVAVTAKVESGIVDVRVGGVAVAVDVQTGRDLVDRVPLGRADEIAVRVGDRERVGRRAVVVALPQGVSRAGAARVLVRDVDAVVRERVPVEGGRR